MTLGCLKMTPSGRATPPDSGLPRRPGDPQERHDARTDEVQPDNACVGARIGHRVQRIAQQAHDLSGKYRVDQAGAQHQGNRLGLELLRRRVGRREPEKTPGTPETRR